ncbi:hypothetical protein ACWD4G_22210 [Streptomyces sp. NPDC002643]
MLNTNTNTDADTAHATEPADPARLTDLPEPQPRFGAEAHRWARWSGLVVGFVVGWQFLTMGNEDIAEPITWGTAAFGLCAVAGVLLGDALTPRPRDAVRTASLTPRRIRDHVPPRMAPLLVAQSAFLVVLLAIGAATATEDKQGRPDRALALTCDGIHTVVGPWPGLFYSVPMLAALAVGTPACVWALRRVAHGPGDDQQRHDRAWAITGAWGLMVSGQLVLVVLMIATMLMEAPCAAPLSPLTVLVIYPLGFLSLFTAAWSLATVVVPRAVADEPATGDDPTDEDEPVTGDEPSVDGDESSVDGDEPSVDEDETADEDKPTDESEPVAGDEPVAEDEPTEEDEPAATKTPADTETPAVAETSADTKTPAPSDEPGEGKKARQGDDDE